MDEELLIALCVLWLSTTSALIASMLFWFFNEGESFHPHSVDIDHRHSLFVVVHSETCCKVDCCVKSISAFVAPRGSSSSKQFTVLCAMISVSGFLGSYRWYKVGDGQLLEVILSLSGFASLLLVAMFELDVMPEKFLEDKLLVTGWLLQRLGLSRRLPFNSNDVHSEEFVDFIRGSKKICHLYEEIDYLANRSSDFKEWKKPALLWASMHMAGAVGFVVLVTAAVLINEHHEGEVAWITGICFFAFSFLGYLTGNYLPVLRVLRCWILLWNPFLREPNFMLLLKQSALEYIDQRGDAGDETAVSIMTSPSPPPSPSPSKSLKRRKGKGKKSAPRNASPVSPARGVRSEASLSLSFAEQAREADLALNNFSLRMARRYPKTYLKVVGHLLVMSELIALLTPAIAMGIQWVTALCDGPPVPAMIELVSIGLNCLLWGDCTRTLEASWSHCILKK